MHAPTTIPVRMLGAAGQTRLLGELKQQCCQVSSLGSRLVPVHCGMPWPLSTAAAANISPLHFQQHHQQQQQVCWHQQQQHHRQRLRCSSVSRQSSAAGHCSSCCAAQPAASQGFPPLVRPGSRAGQRPSRSVSLRVVALERDEDYEQPPEAGEGAAAAGGQPQLRSRRCVCPLAQAAGISRSF